MTTKEKIIKIMQQASQEFNEKFDENFQLRMKEMFRNGETRRIYGSETYDEYIADALIAAGIGDCAELRDVWRALLETQCKRTEEAEHRAEVAERALEILAHKIAFEDLSDMDIIKVKKLKQKVIKQAAKELAEENTDDKK